MGNDFDIVSISCDHQIGKIIDTNTQNKDLSGCDVAILFTTPDSVVQNIKLCLDHKVPVVCGTTGWLEKYDYITDYCKRKDPIDAYRTYYINEKKRFAKWTKRDVPEWFEDVA